MYVSDILRMLAFNILSTNNAIFSRENAPHCNILKDGNKLNAWSQYT